MISKAQVKVIRSLHQKKYREEQKLFIAEGPKIVKELLNSKYCVKEIYATQEYNAEDVECDIQEINEKEFAQISALITPNQVLGVFEIPESIVNINLLQQQLVVGLDDIRDPGNLGTIIRIADWFGINHILCSETCVDVYNPKVVQATMGSLSRVNIHYVNLSIVLKQFKLIYATLPEGKNMYDEKLSDNGIILIGNESRGISADLLEQVTHKLAIPNFSKGADSLNAAIATAVICSEFRRNHSPLSSNTSHRD